jgi:predicted RNA-binding protein with RPS1 domain
LFAAPCTSNCCTQEGSVVTGVVTKLATFGAFVDIGGVRGLVHISQIKDGYIGDLAEVLSVGEVVTARVIKVEPYVGRVSLSMRALVGTTHEVQARTRPRDSPRKENDSVPEHIQVGWGLQWPDMAVWCRGVLMIGGLYRQKVHFCLCQEGLLMSMLASEWTLL